MSEYYDAGRLIQYGLQPLVHPTQNKEYADLIERAQSDRGFSQLVSTIASGLGLETLAENQHGLRLAPTPGSVFEMSAAEVRNINPASAQGADDRLIGFLIDVAICTLIYPRPRDLEEDPEKPRSPVRVQEVEDMLRSLCARIETSLKDAPDPETHELEGRLFEAWQAYHRRYADKETGSGQRGRHGTIRLIESHLDFMAAQGLFGKQGDKYQPLYAYQVNVLRGVAVQLLDIVHSLEGAPAPTSEVA